MMFISLWENYYLLPKKNKTKHNYILKLLFACLPVVQNKNIREKKVKVNFNSLFDKKTYLLCAAAIRLKIILNLHFSLFFIYLFLYDF